MLREALAGVLNEKERGDLYSAFDQVGGIIIIRIPDVLMHRRKVIGDTLLERIKAARSVYCQISDVSGEHRTRNLELIAGEDDTRTSYVEYGCRFTVDVERAFFSPRLSTERGRIAGLVRDGETVVNLFGGIGMFSVIMAKSRQCTVYNIDVNPDAARLCDANIAKNRLAGNVVSINADARTAASRLGRISERTLMLLPEHSDEFLDVALGVTRPGGTIHYYSHVAAPSKREAPGLAAAHLKEVCDTPFEVLDSRLVRAVGPRYYQTVVDFVARTA